MAEPDEADLERYFQDNMEQFRAPDQITFIQVFFDPDKRGDDTLGGGFAEPLMALTLARATPYVIGGVAAFWTIERTVGSFTV